ncbi:hypothetical protein O1611_g3965 [Lasiodiplodia mahajangana]|uniref:Uncharacterized protein n=1 Tax=Lasiodiplodia mahajangana TaxID=1108764 RepID=A0ACC2JR59_9PEZI|nr:hypothetical protein O1611_g3965 [Lasiodiplodia mahajangana]
MLRIRASSYFSKFRAAGWHDLGLYQLNSRLELIIGLQPLPTTMANRYLATLSPELVAAVLSNIDSIRDLSNFIRINRFIYAIFMDRKKLIMFRVLRNELQHLSVNDEFLDRFPLPDHQDTFGRWRTRGQRVAYAYRLGPERRDALRDALRNVLRTEPQSIPSQEELNTLAFCRRQVLCNASLVVTARAEYRRDNVPRMAAIGNTSNHQGFPLGLFSVFEPWGLQQIDQMDRFVIWEIGGLSYSKDAYWEPLSKIYQRVEYLASAVRKYPRLPRPVGDTYEMYYVGQNELQFSQTL